MVVNLTIFEWRAPCWQLMLISKKTGERSVEGSCPRTDSWYAEFQKQDNHMSFRDVRLGGENIKISRSGREWLPFKSGDGLPRDGGREQGWGRDLEDQEWSEVHVLGLDGNGVTRVSALWSFTELCFVFLWVCLISQFRSLKRVSISEGFFGDN